MMIRLLGLAQGGDHEHAGRYVIAYDPEYHLPDGSYDGGKLVTTPDVRRAANFSPAEAVRVWLSGPSCRCHRVQSDGKRNQPLTAFHVEIG